MFHQPNQNESQVNLQLNLSELKIGYQFEFYENSTLHIMVLPIHNGVEIQHDMVVKSQVDVEDSTPDGNEVEVEVVEETPGVWEGDNAMQQ